MSLIDSGWTVGIPTFNRKSLLADALRSVEDQVLGPQHIILSDNCSTDGTGLVRPAGLLSRLTYIRHDAAITPLENFKSSLSLCSTDYFSWLQDDDVIFPEFGKYVMNALRSNPDAVAAIGFAYQSRDIDRIHSLQTTVWGPPPFKMRLGVDSIVRIPQYCLIPWLTCYWPGFSPIAIYRTEYLREAVEALPLEGYGVLLGEKYIAAGLNRLGCVLYVPAVFGVLRCHGNNESLKISSSNSLEVLRATNDLFVFLMSCLPGRLEDVKLFFLDSLSYFEDVEVRAMLDVLQKKKDDLSNLVVEWILEMHPAFAKAHIRNGLVAARLWSFLLIVSRNFFPPVLVKFLRWSLLSAGLPPSIPP